LPLRDEKARRLVTAVLHSLAEWEQRCLEIADYANPGNKVRALSLAKDLEQARVSLQRLVDRADKG
jgi:PHD/YefM family antitoxin component YafN of YafNO toxin-antitoxin module